MEFQSVPLDKITESGDNPRKTFKGLDELAETVKKSGIINPLLVRPLGDGYEILDGARRYRAARAAGLVAVPVHIRAVPDDVARDIRILANLQREDVHPLEEANGFHELMEKNHYTAAELAARVGKSETYIYQRLKLPSLIAPAQELLMNDHLPLSYATLIARLPPDTQKEALDVVYEVDDFEKWNGVDDFTQEELDDYNPEIHIQTLRNWINNCAYLDLSRAPFDLAAGSLPCMSCQNRTGFTPALFPDITGNDTCLDRRCYEAKVEAHIAVKKAQYGPQLALLSSFYGNREDESVFIRSQYREVEEASCPHARLGMLIDGARKGSLLHICPEPKCEVHGSGGKNEKGPQMESHAEAAARRAERDVAVVAVEKERAVRKMIFDAIMDAAGQTVWGLDGKSLHRIVAAGLMERSNSYRIGEMFPETPKLSKGDRGDVFACLCGMNDAALKVMILKMSLHPYLDVYYEVKDNSRPEALCEAARFFNIDCDVIEHAAEQELAATEE